VQALGLTGRVDIPMFRRDKGARFRRTGPLLFLQLFGIT
jgi:hypothetical protein